MRKPLAFFLLFLVAIEVIAGYYFVTNTGIIDEDGNEVLKGTISAVFTDGKLYYAVAQDGVYTIDAGTKIDLKNPVYLNNNYVLSQNVVYKIENAKAVNVGNVSSKLKSIVVRNDHIVGIENNSVVCYFSNRLVWSMEIKATKISISENYLAVFSSQTQLFDITNPKIPKLVGTFPSFKEYAYFSGYHAFSDDSKIYLYKGVVRQSVTFNYKGTLISDGKSLFSGSLMIDSSLKQTDLEFTTKSLVFVPREEPQPQPPVVPTTVAQTLSEQQSTPSTPSTTEIKPIVTQEPVKVVPEQKPITPPQPKRWELVWKMVINDEISGKPAVKDSVLYIPTLRGTVYAVKEGKTLWTFKTSFVVVGNVTVGKNVYVTSWDDTIYAINEQGKVVWSLKLNDDLSQGVAWDGLYLYAVTDSGDVYLIQDTGVSGNIKKNYKVGSYPVIPPSISLSGKVFIVDGTGTLWQDSSRGELIGKVWNLPIISERIIENSGMGFSLIDEVSIIYKFVPNVSETRVLRLDYPFLTIEGRVKDAVVGKENIYILNDKDTVFVYNKVTKQLVTEFKVPGAKYISAWKNYLYVFGSEIHCYYVQEEFTGFWYSIYGNSMNWNSAIR